CNARLTCVVDEPVLRNAAKRTGKERQEILHSLNTPKRWKESGTRYSCAAGNADKAWSISNSLNRCSGSHAPCGDRVRRITAKASEEAARAGRNSAAAAADGTLRTAVTILAAKTESVLTDGQTDCVSPRLSRCRIVQQLQWLKTARPDRLIRVEVRLSISQQR